MATEEERRRFRGIKPGEELTREKPGPALEAIKKVVGGVAGAITGGEPVTPYRGYGLDEQRGMGFMEAGVPISEDLTGVRQAIPTRPAVGGITGTPPAAIDLTPPAGRGDGVAPTGPVDLMPRHREIAAGIEGALPAAFDTEKAHKLAMERYPEGKAYIPSPVFGPALDKVLGPAQPRATAPQAIASGVDERQDLADAWQRYGQRTDIIPGLASGATGSGRGKLSDVLKYVAENVARGKETKQLAEEKKSALDVERFETGQLFKERKLASEEAGRESALDISRRKAIASEAKGADKLDPFMHEAEKAVRSSADYDLEPDPRKKNAMILEEAARIEKRHGRKKPGGETVGKEGKPSIEAFINAAKEQGSAMSPEALEAEFKKRYGA